MNVTSILASVFVGILLFSATLGESAEPPITAVAFAPDGKSVVAVSQAGLHQFSWPELKRIRSFEAFAANLHCLTFSPKGDKLAVGSGNPAQQGIVEIFSWPQGNSIDIVERHEDSIMAIAWLDDSKVLSASLDRDFMLTDVATGDDLQSYQGHSRGVTSLCLLQDGKTLISTGHDQSVRVWDVESGELIRSLSQHTAPVHVLALRPTKEGLPMVASAAGDRTIRFWQPTIGRMVRYVRLDAEPLDIAWLNDVAHIVASCTDGHIRVIDADEVKVVDQRRVIDGWAYALAVHPSDGSIAVGGSGGQLRRIEVRADPVSRTR